ncbi:MAG: hypothetical protein JWO38_273 [Gemmataceae bacterium]|nr:hypothetical protein [Gemmataceae bacterium]
MQLVEKGSLLRQLAEQHGQRRAVRPFGSVKNRAQRLQESLRYLPWPVETFDLGLARKTQIRLNSSLFTAVRGLLVQAGFSAFPGWVLDGGPRPRI